MLVSPIKIQNNNPSFNAKLSLSGHYDCLNKKQISELTKIAERVGKSKDKINLYFSSPKILNGERRIAERSYIEIERQIEAYGTIKNKDFNKLILMRSFSYDDKAQLSSITVIKSFLSNLININ